MKNLLFVLFCTATSLCAVAQTSEEFLQQKKMQRKYLVQQIAALKVYTGYVQKGYAIVKNGLTAISDNKNGEFKLHKDFFTSMRKVHPKISAYAKVTAIIAIQVQIVKSYSRSYQQVRQSKAFNNDEIRYISGVYKRLMGDCADALDDLLTVSTDNKFDMKDDERLKRIDELYKQMQDKLTFIRSFNKGAIMLANNRIKDENDIENSRLLNGIKK